MIPSKECMKSILKYISEHAKVKVDDMAYHNIEIGSLNVSTLLEQMSKEGKYTMEEIAYNFLQCYYNRLVDANINHKDEKTIMSPTSSIVGLTLLGAEFMIQD